MLIYGQYIADSEKLPSNVKLIVIHDVYQREGYSTLKLLWSVKLGGRQKNGNFPVPNQCCAREIRI